MFENIEHRRPKISMIAFVALTILANGCTSMQVLDTGTGNPLASVVEPGDQLKITTNENEVVSLVVESVDSSSVSGSGRTVLIEEIQRLEVRRPSPGRTVILAVLVVALTAAGLAEIASNTLVPVTPVP